MRALTLLVSLTTFLVTVAGDERDKPAAKAPEDRVRALLDEYESAHQALINAALKAKTAEEREAVNQLPGRKTPLFAPGFMKLAREYPGTTAAEDALVWVGSHLSIGPEAEEARLLLVRDHIRSDKLAPVIAFQAHFPLSEGAENLLRGAIDQNPDRKIQGLSTYWLGRVLQGRAVMARYREKLLSGDHPEEWQRGMELQHGLGWMDRLRRADPEALDHEAEMLFLRVAKEFGDVPHNDKRRPAGSLREAALAYLHEFQDLTIGKPAPEVEGTDLEGKGFRLTEYRGKVVVIEFGSHFF
jgi:hypothetical protein